MTTFTQDGPADAEETPVVETPAAPEAHDEPKEETDAPAA